MKILIVENEVALARLWAGHLKRSGHAVTCAETGEHAIELLDDIAFDIIILDTTLPNENAVNVGDYARFRLPETKIICLTGRRFFSNGTIFDLLPNACAFTPPSTPPEDLAALVEYHGAR